ncbi:MAG: hypothetical protein ACKOD3_03260 [Phenylobacterium sp.]
MTSLVNTPAAGLPQARAAGRRETRGQDAQPAAHLASTVEALMLCDALGVHVAALGRAARKEED